MKKLLSYLFPISLKDYPSEIHGVLKVRLKNGRKTLDTEKTNYSYGSLQRILHTGLSQIRLDSSTESILVLGLGGGSVVETIRERFHSKAHITLIDIDPLMISLAEDEFDIRRFENIDIREHDAYEYLRSSTQRFDLIIVDIFLMDTIPPIFTESPFIRELIGHMSTRGKIVYNTMRRSLKKEVLKEMISLFQEGGLQVKVLEKIAGSNDIIIGEK